MAKSKRKVRDDIDDDPMFDTSPAAKDRANDRRLELLIERYERLGEEKKGLSDDQRDVKAEAKAVGYDGKMFTEMVRLRKMKPDDRREFEALRETYKAELGID